MTHIEKKTHSAIGIEVIGMTMRFGSFTALNQVSLKIPPGHFHALLGENGAGKSTLVKCMMGFYQATEGEIIVNGRQAEILAPQDAHALGLGMVYQHFTLAPSLTAAENLLVSRRDASTVIHWSQEKQKLTDFLGTMPFTVPLERKVYALSAGEKQKLEILKQLYLGCHFLILDEPTSVLTLSEADEVLGLIRQLCQAGQITALMISHKFREVTTYADEVTILRKGERVGQGQTSQLSVAEMATMMVGKPVTQNIYERQPHTPVPVLSLENICCEDRSGLKSIEIDSLNVCAGEIVGVAGVSGNGQVELMEVLTGQRSLQAGGIYVQGEPFRATREEAFKHNVRFLPEEPLHNACVPGMSVKENIALRDFDRDPQQKRLFWLKKRLMRSRSAQLVTDFNVKTTSLDTPIESLSGGNIQRAVLARELTGKVDLLIISNPCFGLDFSAVADIRDRIMQARNAGAAVLLISEDLDEIMELSDRVLVMSEGQITYESPIEQTTLEQIGQHMAGHRTTAWIN